MLRTRRSVLGGASLLVLSMGLLPALSGCESGNKEAIPTPSGMTPEEAKAKADQETLDAFKAQQKAKK